MSVLIDTMPFTPQILESSDDGIMRIQGVFQRAETKNANGRVYGRKLWERLLSESSTVRQRINERAMLGHLEHPSDGVTDLNKGAILITGLKLDEKNQIIGTAEVLDTPAGKTAQEYINKKVRIGISSRGSGTVGADGRVSEDYKLETFDLVYNPSTPGAHPSLASNKEKTESEVPEKREPKTSEPTTNVIKENAMANPVEKLQGLEISTKPLLEQDITKLLPYQVTDIDNRLLEASVQLGALIAENPAVAVGAQSLQERINAKRNAISNPEKVQEDNQEDIEELEDLTEGIEDLDEIEEDEIVSLDDLEDALEQVEEEAASEAIIGEAEEEIKNLREQIEAAELLQVATTAKLVKVQAERDVAAALLRESASNSKAEEVAEAISECLEEDPQLQSVVDILAECTSKEEVYERVIAIQEAKDDDEDVDEDVEDIDEEDFDFDLDDDEDDDEDVSESVKTKRSKKERNSIFEDIDDIDDEDLASEDDVSHGVLESARDMELASHKGRRLVLEAVKRVGC